MNPVVHANIWGVAAQNLRRYKGKTIATLIPLLLVIAVFSAMNFMRDGMLQDALLATEALPDITVQKMSGGRADKIPVGMGARIGGMASVRQVIPRVWGYVPLHAGDKVLTCILMGQDVRAMPSSDMMRLSMQTGEFIDADDMREAVVGQAFAKAIRVGVGDEFNITDELGNRGNFRVKGMFDSDVQIYAADMIVVPIAAARRFFEYGADEATDLCVYLDDPRQADAVAGQIRADMRNLRVLTKDSLKAVNQLAYGKRAGIFQLIWMILLLTVGLIAWSEAGSILLHIKREIGILKALGWSTLDVVEMKVFENLIIGVLATAGGMLLGLLYVLVGAPGIKTYFLGWAAVFPPVQLPLHVGFGTVCLIMVIGIFPLLVATVIPAWSAGVIDPDEAIRC